MNLEKITEFVTVLFFALLVGGSAMLAIQHLEGARLAIAILVLIAVTIACWQFLRRRFGRNR